MAGGNAGLRPQEILDLTMWEFNAFCAGRNDHLLELRALAAESGFYSAYYGHNKKKPRTLKSIITQLMYSRTKPSSERNRKRPKINTNAIAVMEHELKEGKKHGKL